MRTCGGVDEVVRAGCIADERLSRRRNKQARGMPRACSGFFNDATQPVFCPTRQTIDLEQHRKDFLINLHSGRRCGRIQRENHSSASLRGLPGSSDPKIGGGMR